MDWYVIWQYRWDLWSGFLLTVQISSVAIVGASILGIVVGWLHSLPSFFLARLTGAYVQVLRNIPAVVKLFFVYFVIGMDAMFTAITVLVMHHSAYIADITAAGLRSVPGGQVEAGLSSGLGYRQLFVWILLPQAARAMLPPLTTQVTQIIKNSSIVSLIALQDLTFMTQRISLDTYRGFEAATAVTILYLLLIAIVIVMVSLLHQWLQRRYEWN